MRKAVFLLVVFAITILLAADHPTCCEVVQPDVTPDEILIFDPIQGL